VHNDVPYGDDYRWDRCYDGVPENMSTACAAHFLNEACFYECDVHVGKWRRHDDCKDDAGADNAWQIAGMPIKKSECDQFYQDCKDDLFCVSNESKSFFALPTCNHDTQCQTFGSIYTGGKEMCELLWDHSFKYEPVEANAYTWSFAEGAANPNNGILPSVPFPEQCANFNIDPTDCVPDVQMLNQHLLHVESDLTSALVPHPPPSRNYTTRASPCVTAESRHGRSKQWDTRNQTRLKRTEVSDRSLMTPLILVPLYYKPARGGPAPRLRRRRPLR
jgi:hypothetical protein